MDYGSQLWSPYLTKHINMIEKTQRSFTRYISGMQGLSYPERLAVLKLYYLQRRREIYIIIYVWKTSLLLYVLEHLIVEEEHVLHLMLGTLAYNSFRWRAICMFNQLPLSLRNTTICSVYSFKKKFDLYLSTVPDIPCRPGFSNSLDHGDCLRWRTPRDGLADN